jgi:hypothetical protein
MTFAHRGHSKFKSVFRASLIATHNFEVRKQPVDFWKKVVMTPRLGAL